jgi:hypothetical protein
MNSAVEADDDAFYLFVPSPRQTGSSHGSIRITVTTVILYHLVALRLGGARAGPPAVLF